MTDNSIPLAAEIAPDYAQSDIAGVGIHPHFRLAHRRTRLWTCPARPRCIENAQRIVMACHINPDGDALGSLLALGTAILDKYPAKDITPPVPRRPSRSSTDFCPVMSASGSPPTAAISTSPSSSTPAT